GRRGGPGPARRGRVPPAGRRADGEVPAAVAELRRARPRAVSPLLRGGTGGRLRPRPGLRLGARLADPGRGGVRHHARGVPPPAEDPLAVLLGRRRRLAGPTDP